MGPFDFSVHDETQNDHDDGDGKEIQGVYFGIVYAGFCDYAIHGYNKSSDTYKMAFHSIFLLINIEQRTHFLQPLLPECISLVA